jgi:hypothetical protein
LSLQVEKSLPQFHEALWTQGVGASVVFPVIQGDQRKGSSGERQGNISNVAVSDDLVLCVREEGADIE